MKISQLLILIAVLGVAFFMFAPDDRIEAVLSLFDPPHERPRTGPAATECLEHYLDRFNHPDTVELVDSTLENDQVFIEVRADNSFGVPVRTKLNCLLDETGQFDSGKTLGRDIRRLTSD